MVVVVVLGVFFLKIIGINSNVNIVVDPVIQRIRVGICMVIHRSFKVVLHNKVLLLEVVEDIDSMVVDQVSIL